MLLLLIQYLPPPPPTFSILHRGGWEGGGTQRGSLWGKVLNKLLKFLPPVSSVSPEFMSPLRTSECDLIWNRILADVVSLDEVTLDPV